MKGRISPRLARKLGDQSFRPIPESRQKSRTEIKRETVMVGGTLDDAEKIISATDDGLDELLMGTLGLVIRAAWERGRMGQSEGTSDSARNRLASRIRELVGEALLNERRRILRGVKSL